RRPLVVEAIAFALKADAVDAGGQRDKSTWRGRRRRRTPIGLVAGRHRILREGVQDVGENELLMLLLVMEADLEDAQDLGQLRIASVGEQAFDSRVDMGAKRG